MKTPRIRHREHSDAFFQLESRGVQSAQQLKTAATSRRPWQQSRRISNTTDILFATQRQVLVIKKASRKVDIPLLQYSDTAVDFPVAKQRREDNCMTKYNEIQMDNDSESRSDLSFTVQQDSEVIHREVKGGTKINCDPKDNQSEFSETPRLKDLVKKHSERIQEEGEPRYTLCNIDYTSEDGCPQTKLTPE